MANALTPETPTIAADRTEGSAGAATSRRVGLFLVLALATTAGFLLTDASATGHAVTEAGDDLTRLLRGMAALKMMLAAPLLAGVGWRFGAPVARLRLVAYVVVCGAMVLGPGLIWGMVHVRLGAFLLHAGLLGSLVMLWRDPANGERLAAILARRRAATRGSRSDA